jgi:type III restriction enzyme
MAMAIVWARFHKQRVPGSEMSTNFLIVAPNVIVYQRLERDFAANRVFYELPLIPPEWRGAFSQKVILRGEAAEPDPSGNLFLTNVHQLYESRDAEWTPITRLTKYSAEKPSKDLAAAGQRSMLERVKSLKDLVVLNDEAHHVHDEDLQWSQSLLAVHRALPKGLALWLDFSATPKDQNGMYFPWTVCDYPLAQAVEGPHRQGAADRHQGGRPQAAERRSPMVSRRTTSERNTATGYGRQFSAGRSTKRSTSSSAPGRCFSSWRRRMYTLTR